MTLTTLLASAALTLASFDSGIHGLTDYSIEVSGGAVTYVTTFHDDGSYTTDVGIAGSWEVVDGELCITRTTGESGCQPMAHSVSLGDSWDSQDAAGNAVTVTVVERQ